MTAIFKCRNCDEVFDQPLARKNPDKPLIGLCPELYEIWGLLVFHCPKCGHDYMDCQNFDECLEALGV